MQVKEAIIMKKQTNPIRDLAKTFNALIYNGTFLKRKNLLVSLQSGDSFMNVDTEGLPLDASS